jgi:BirA family biotin operon repressor/biotin-[acetyl-CoA-carboxylase] ligase
MLLADGQFHSGVSISKRLGISRTTVWKQLKLLKQSGLEFSAVTGKGYRLESALELLDRQRILTELESSVKEQINGLHIHDSLTSTNNFLFDQAVATGAEICLTEYQSAGKGRRGRQWVSPFGSNIYLSVSWQYQQGPATVSGLSLAAGVAVGRALTLVGVSDIGLKWPNDIYWQQKKLGGILVEVRGDSEGPCSVVVGIGINLVLSATAASHIDQPWVDLRTINNGERTGRNLLIATILNQLIPIMADFDQTGIQALVDEWRRYDCMHGKQVTLIAGNNNITGVVQGIDDQGLITLLVEGEIKAYASGEVTFHSDL